MTLEKEEIGVEEEVLSPELAKILKPEETAIIVVDVMKAYFDENEILPQLVGAKTTQLDTTADKINEFLKKSRKFGIAACVFARMTERPDAMPSNYRYKMEAVDKTPPLVEVGGSGWDYYKVKPEEGDLEITKNHYSAFKKTDLDQYLRSKGVQTVIIVGGYASVCVC